MIAQMLQGKDIETRSAGGPMRLEDGRADKPLHWPHGVVTNELDHLSDLLSELCSPVVSGGRLRSHVQ